MACGTSSHRRAFVQEDEGALRRALGTCLNPSSTTGFCRRAADLEARRLLRRDLGLSSLRKKEFEPLHEVLRSAGPDSGVEAKCCDFVFMS